MYILNFTHPLTQPQLDQIEAETGQPIEQVIEQMAHFDNESDFGPQVRALVEGVGLSTSEWQTVPVVVNPPGFAPGAACLLAELHGRMGYFPALLRIRPVAGSTPRLYEVAEVVNLQSIREGARGLRS